MPTDLHAKLAKAVEDARSAARADDANAVVVVDVTDDELEQFEQLTNPPRDRGPWAARVLDDEQSTEAVVALISNEVDQRAKVRETQRSTRFGLGVSLAAVSAAAIFAIVGWLFNKGLLEAIEQKIAGLRSEIPLNVKSAVDGFEEDMDVVIAGRVDRELAIRVPEEVEKQIELEQLFLQATILSVQLELGTQYLNSDRDRMMQYFERFADEPSITERPDFDAILRKSIDSFAAASNNYQVDRLVELYPEKCFGLQDLALLLMEHYGRQLAGSELPPSDWPETHVTSFERAYQAVTDLPDGLKIGIRLLVAQRAADTESVDALIESISSLDATEAKFIVGYLLSNSHWTFISKRQTRSVSARANVAQALITSQREALDDLIAKLDDTDMTDVVTRLFIEARNEGQSAHDLREAADLLLEILDGHEWIETTIAYLRSNVLR